jgi:hypothetical protein
MTQDIDAIADKVRKLLALATSSNPHEAALAAARAQDLMFRYNLELSQVQTDRQGDSYVKQDVTLSGAKSGDRNWRRLLMATIARNTFCKAIYYSGRGTRDKREQMAIIGQRHNIKHCQYLYEYLARELERMERLAWDAYCAVTWTSERVHWLTYANNFYRGAVTEIERRLMEQRKASETAAEVEGQGDASRALVVLTAQQLQEATHRFFPKLTAGRLSATRNHSGEAYRAGREAGRSVPIRRGVEGPTTAA